MAYDAESKTLETAHGAEQPLLGEGAPYSEPKTTEHEHRSMVSNVAHNIADTAHTAGDAVAGAGKRAYAGAMHGHKAVAGFTRRNPTLVLLIALGVGAATARLLHRR